MREYLPTEDQISRVAELSGAASTVVEAVLSENNRYTRLIRPGLEGPAETASRRQEIAQFRSCLPRIPSAYAERPQWRLQFLVNRLDLDPELIIGILNAFLSDLVNVGRMSATESGSLSGSLTSCSQGREHYYPADLGAVDRAGILARHLERFAPLDRDRKAAILMGPFCAGKTTIRREKYGRGYLHLDSADLFVALAGSAEPRFSGPYLAELDAIGRRLFEVGVENGFNLVIEVIGSEANILIAMMTKLRSCDYRVEVVHIHAPFEECVRRQEVRGDDNLSAYYTEGFHQAWVLGLPAW